MNFTIEIEKEDDDRWIAEVVEIPGAMAYGSTPDEARTKALHLADEVIADRQQFGEMSSFESPGGTA